MSNTSEDWCKHFILMNDLYMVDYTFNQGVIAPDTDMVVAGFQGIPFAGVFDGNSHVIHDLYITASEKDYIGLFGNIGSGSQIKNIGVENANIQGRNYVGVFTGLNDGKINNCNVFGSIVSSTNSWYLGGLVGYNNGSIKLCYTTGTASGYRYVGGLVGFNVGSISFSYSSGAVSGYQYIGNLVGRNGGGIASSYATGVTNGSRSHPKTSILE